MDRLEAIDGTNWEVFIQNPWAVLVLGKTDCDHIERLRSRLRRLRSAAGA